MTSPWQLADLGWHPHFAAQLEPGAFESFLLVRVVAVHRDALEVVGPAFEGRIAPFEADADPDPARHRATVGDWLVLDRDTRRPTRLLERRSLLKRKSVGAARQLQLLAANIDTLLLVTSATDEFNPARIERYLAIAREAEVMPVVVITKADLVSDARPYLATARSLAPGLIVEAVDARSLTNLAGLAPWLARGQTVALLGSSGVGKSTLVNSLSGAGRQTTAATGAEAKGRHTTTSRSLHPLAGGAWLLDTPGMRELQLVDAADGIDQVFDDVATLALACRFTACTHESEPACAVQEALARGDLDPARLARYRKLVREERHNSESIAEARARSRAFGKVAKTIMQAKKRRHSDP